MIDHVILIHTYINMCILYIYMCVCVCVRERERKGFPGGSDGKESACSTGDLSLIPELGRSPGKGQWQLTPVFLPGESHGQWSLA